MREEITWNYVKDKLPKTDMNVLITNKFGGVYQCSFEKKRKKFFDWEREVTEYVIAWAELPKGAVIDESGEH